MLHNEVRHRLVQGYIKTRKAKGMVEAYFVSVPTVYRLARQMKEAGSVALRVNLRGWKKLLSVEEFAPPQNGKPRRITPAPSVMRSLAEREAEQNADRRKGGRHGTMN